MITRPISQLHMQVSHWKDHTRHQIYQIFSSRLATGLSSPSVPRISEQQFIMQGFILGILSIFCSFFPICGLPLAISGLIIGLADRRAGHQYKMTTLTIALSIIGLMLTLINIIIGISIYLSFYVWQ